MKYAQFVKAHRKPANADIGTRISYDPITFEVLKIRYTKWNPLHTVETITDKDDPRIKAFIAAAEQEIP